MTDQELAPLSVMVDLALMDAKKVQRESREVVRGLARLRDALEEKTTVQSEEDTTK